MTLAPSIRGDFVLAGGPQAAAWLGQLPGFTIASAEGDALTLAMRDRVQTGATATGSRWLALADLVQGTLQDAADDAEAFPQKQWRGRFAFASWRNNGGAIHASTDHFGSLPLYWYQRDGHYAVASDLRLLLDAPGVRREADLTAVYHYLNFACIPAPATICRDIRRMEPGTRLTLGADVNRLTRYYVPEYPADLHGSDEKLAADLRERMIASVHAFRPHADAGWGCFLSGGTDSSSIVSILSRQGGAQVQSCSIGFPEAGYDELDFARITSEACGARPHLAQVDHQRALGLLDSVIDAYDQPFGNASAAPTMACAELGKTQGFSQMLGGDGGDEIFGGNQRYAKDKVMESFYGLPSPLKAAARALGKKLGGGNNHMLNRVRELHQAGVLAQSGPLLHRRFLRLGLLRGTLTPELRRHVDRDASLDFMRGCTPRDRTPNRCTGSCGLDLMMAIAQNDLVKVHRACKHHGVSVRFPYLDPALVDYCGRLPARLQGARPQEALPVQAGDGRHPAAMRFSASASRASACRSRSG